MNGSPSVPVQCPRGMPPCSVRAAPPPPPLVQQCPYSACPVFVHRPVQPPCSPRAVPIQCPVQCPCNAPMQRPVQCPCAASRAAPAQYLRAVPVQCRLVCQGGRLWLMDPFCYQAENELTLAEQGGTGEEATKPG
ncbi:uncharacterized protein GAS8-AS1-like [Peromyscus leucopus]|uniref:uncharacterized protein GAS8-AS1-like n=1 Tax=Peromyscus leucopus TaxID=10041 RepID=UPI0018855EE3|nr:uncharacterized protein GAS8-AS1-like [Peromyscus leucopus]